ncbi:alpha-D-xyloside xylohydrolase [Dyadobacter jejuensis]|uniref:Alpha-D-xyloside xylohydrolase n=1 Tax=Dyadobacter jejuensis TaxID=1082580 RepID=A0A316AK06_9BACT|nr:TIM-barrel domain-containing protein [Dyadobacter jejuensis]PWJ57589.1 alpha-D-xyloside xylohydrolase [Dyadobacter jejuensis]
MKRLFLFLIFSISFLNRIRAQTDDFQWKQVAPGVWKAVVGAPETISPLGVAGIKPMTEALGKLGSPAFPSLLKESKNGLTDGKVYLRFPLERHEQLFGLGLNFKSVQQRGTIKTLQVDHYAGKDNGRTHAPVPFYVSDKGYGVLINSARYIKIYAGTTVRKDSKNPPPEMDRNSQRNWNPNPYSDAVEVLIPAPGTEIYVFAGKTAMEVVQRYNLYCGGGTLPPKWGLGFTYRTPTLFSDQQIIREVAEFEKKGYPLSFVGLEPGWQSHSYPNSFVWDPTRFPNPKQFLDNLLTKNIRVNLWINPYVSSRSPIFKSIQPYTASHTVWVGEVPDFNTKPARDLFKGLFTEQHINKGVSGYKVDETDGYDQWLWPDVAQFPSGFSAEQVRQTYGLQFQKISSDWFREKNTRTYGLVRASNAGASALPYVLYNDYYNHKDFITALCNSSFIGVLWTPEARSSKTSEEWLRRFQSVCFSPMAMLNAWADGTKPWTFPEVADQVKEVMQLRMQLLPYLYTTFAQYHYEGKPPVRAMNLIDGFTFEVKTNGAVLSSTDNPYAQATRSDIKDQYMFGDYLLVAPFFAGETSRKVVLPQGKWYDFYTGKIAGEGETIVVSQPEPGRIPLFVKDGGIIPMIPPMLHAPLKDQVLPLTVRHYGSIANSWDLYDDDGETFDFEGGAHSWTKLAVNKKADGSLEGTVKASPGNLFHYHAVNWEYMTPRP